MNRPAYKGMYQQEMNRANRLEVELRKQRKFAIIHTVLSVIVLIAIWIMIK